jgi:hypothetical protein
VWQIDAHREAFLYGGNGGDKAHETAERCPDFKEDCEDERVSDTLISCYNCRYRRWTQASFDCMKGKNG